MSTPLRRYYRGHSLVAMRDEVAGANRYYHFDHQGTTQVLTDSTGAVTDRFAADAWGVQVKRTGTSVNRQWYVGRSGYQQQSSTGRMYARIRWYDPGVARWASRDPVESRENLYMYASNRPVERTDPSGMQPRRIPPWVSIISDADFTSLGFLFPPPLSLINALLVALTLDVFQPPQHPWVYHCCNERCFGSGSGTLRFEEKIVQQSAPNTCVNVMVLITQMQKEQTAVTRAAPCGPSPIRPQATWLMGCGQPSSACEQIQCAATTLCNRYSSCKRGLGNEIFRWERIDPAGTATPPNVKICVGPHHVDPIRRSPGVWLRPRNCATLSLLVYTPNLGGQRLFTDVWNLLFGSGSMRLNPEFPNPPDQGQGSCVP